MNRTPSAQQTLQRLPKKWAVAIVVALILYALVQPLANSRWGWNLPGLGGASSEEKAITEKPVSKPVAKSSSNSNVVADSDTKVAEKKVGSNAGTSSAAGADASENKATGAKTETPKSASSKTLPPKSTAANATNAANSNLLYGLLKDAGREVYISPAGLRYTRGSEEGHRLKHIEKHLKDIPDRPGKHGVFDGDMAQVLRWVDDAFTRGKQGAKGVRKREEDGRTVYEVPFTKPIGYVGGRDGKRDNNPDAKRLRLVVDGDQVITAFPF